MASTYSELKFELMATGEQNGLWGDVTNVNIEALQEAITGMATANFTTDADLTLTLTNTNASQVPRNLMLNVTSGVSLTATRNLIVPTIEKQYLVYNATTGSQSIVVKTSAGTGITIPSGKSAHVFVDGTNVVSAFDYAATLALGTALPLTSGGTGATTQSAARTALGATTVGANFFTLTNPSAITFPRANADNTVSLLSAADFRTAIGAGTGSGDVTTTGTQTLTNKTISADDNTLSGIAASSFVLSNGSGNIDGSAAQKAIPTGVVVGTTDTQTLTNKTLTDPAIVGAITEDVFTITDAAAFEVDPGNGTIQLVTLGANRTPKATNFAAGESVTLMVLDGTARTLTWTDTTWGPSGVVWVGGTAPTLDTTKYTVIEFWKVASQVYGAYVGAA